MTEIQNELFRLTMITFEELVFLMPIPEDEVDPSTPPVDVGASVKFTGEFNGELIVKVPRGILGLLTENILGDEMEPTVKQQLDTLKEISNVICGNVMPAVAGKEKLFSLAPPIIYENLDEIDRTGSKSSEVKVPFDEGVIEIELIVEGDIL